MRRSWVLVSGVGAASMVAGCAIETVPPDPPDPAPETCTVTSVSPAFGASGIGTRPEIRVTYNQAIDATGIESQVGLARLGGEAVDFTVEASGTDTIVIRPQKELRYWEAYQAIVTGAVKSADGLKTCEAVDLAFATLHPQEESQPLRATQVASSVLVDATHLVTASPSARSLQVYSVADATHPALVSEVRVEEGPGYVATDPGATLFPNRLYAAAGARGVPIFDVSDPAAPKRIGLAGTPGEAREVIPFEQEGRAYLAVADTAGGLRMIDVSTPEGAKDVWTGNVIEGAVSIAKQGDLLAVVDLKGYVHLYDVSQATSPVLLSSTPPSPSDDTFGSAIPFNDVALVGNELVASQGYAGFESFDITEPATPVFQQHLLGPQGKCAAGCGDAIADLRVANGVVFASSLLTGAVRLTVSDAGEMTVATTFQAPGRLNSVTVAPDGTLIVGGDAGLFTFDGMAASATASPVYGEANGWGVDYGVALAGEQLYVSSASRGLETFDLTNPLSPTSHALATSPGAERDVGLYDVAVAGSVILVGDGRAGVSVFDASEPNAPVFKASAASNDSAGIVIPSALPNVFYACLDNVGVGVIDTTDPANPVVIDENKDLNTEVGGCKDIQRIGDRVYYSGGTGLAVLDATNPKDLVLKSSLKLPAEDLIGALAYSEAIPDRLFTTTLVVDWEGTHNRTTRLLSFDLTDPDAPTVAYRSDDLGGVRALEVHDTKAFLGGGVGVMVFDLSAPDAPFLEGKIETRGVPQRFAFGDGLLYGAELAGGIGVVRLEPPPAP